MPMTDMALSADEAKKEDCCISPSDSGEDTGPKYPYGLTINLDAVTMKKLGMSTLPKVGEPLQLTAVVEVCSTSQYENQGGSEMNVSLQITHMGFEQGGTDPATALYGS